MKIGLILISGLFTLLVSGFASAEGGYDLSYPNYPYPPHVTCVADCISRVPSGQCLQYLSDFCAQDAVCVPHCIGRNIDGSCFNYMSDYCGTNAECIPQCVARDSSGRCISAISDKCFEYPRRY